MHSRGPRSAADGEAPRERTSSLRREGQEQRGIGTEEKWQAETATCTKGRVHRPWFPRQGRDTGKWGGVATACYGSCWPRLVWQPMSSRDSGGERGPWGPRLLTKLMTQVPLLWRVLAALVPWVGMRCSLWSGL